MTLVSTSFNSRSGRRNRRPRRIGHGHADGPQPIPPGCMPQAPPLPISKAAPHQAGGKFPRIVSCNVLCIRKYPFRGKFLSGRDTVNRVNARETIP